MYFILKCFVFKYVLSVLPVCIFGHQVHAVSIVARREHWMTWNFKKSCKGLYQAMSAQN